MLVGNILSTFLYKSAYPINQVLKTATVKVAVFLFLFFSNLTTYSQWMLINETGGRPDSSAALEISDTTRGLLPPRLTTNQANAINNPANGLLIYNTDSSCYCFYNGTSWELVGSSGGSSNSTGVSSVEESGVVTLKGVKSQGINGGTFTAGSWVTRELNTIDGDTSFIAITSNQFTLESGVYQLEWSAPAYRVGVHKTRIYNVTDASEIEYGSSENINSTEEVATRSMGSAIIELTGSKTLRLEHRCSTPRAVNGLGTASSFGSEVHAQVKITKLDKVFGSGIANSGSNSIDTLNENFFSARISASGTVVSENVDWISNVTKSSSGNYLITFKPGLFSQPPSIQMSIDDQGSSSVNGWSATYESVGTASVNAIVRIHSSSTSNFQEFDRAFTISAYRQGSDYRINTQLSSASSNGNTGVGNTSPAAKLDVSGAIKLDSATNTPLAGMMQYKNGGMEYYDGTVWVPMTPAGLIQPFAGDTSEIPDGWLLCDGRTVSRTTYGRLFSTIKTNWGAGDGSTTFHLPDLRGRFLRGQDLNAGNDLDTAARTAVNTGGNTGGGVGSVQGDAIRNISGSLGTRQDDHAPFTISSGPFSRTNSSGLVNFGASGSGTGSRTINFNASAVVPTGADNRPKNAYVVYIIKY